LRIAQEKVNLKSGSTEIVHMGSGGGEFEGSSEYHKALVLKE